jgi:hypothetical protein
LVNLMANNATLKPKHTMLPLLTVLFLISYGLMTMLVVEQGRTIDAQRTLIRQLFGDSSELTALKGSAGQKHNAEMQGQAKAQSKAQTPSSSAATGDNAKSGHPTGKVRRQVPQKPPQVTSDTQDERRALISI